jgi:hypothetical protein
VNKFKNWFRGLSMTGKVTSIAVAALLSFGAMGAAAQQGKTPATLPTDSTQSQTPLVPKVETKTVTTTEAIPFDKINKDDTSRDVGSSAVTTPGVDGVRTQTFHVTYVDGKETARTQTKSEVTTLPVSEVTSIGTHVPYVPPVVHAAPQQQAASSNCDPNYSGCVPVASDVDCAGGSGNGPAYTGMVQVIGSDIYDLDRDGDGWGCE